MVAMTSTSSQHFAPIVKHTGLDIRRKTHQSTSTTMEEAEKRDCMHQVRIQEGANLKPSHESRKQGGRKPSAVQDEIHHCSVQRPQIFFGKTMNGLSIIEQAKTVGVKKNNSDSNAVSTWYFF